MTDSTFKNQKSLNISPRALPRVLSIAGSDSGGGAGIQADIKSISACGGYALTAITALTAQNTQGVQEVFTPPADFLRAQLDSITADISIDAVKIGMLANLELIETVSNWLTETQPPVVVLDPVMVATSGDALLKAGAVDALRRLATLAHVITPNLHELGVLAGSQTPQNWDDACRLASQLAHELDTCVLVKGGHLAGRLAKDALFAPASSEPIWVGSSLRTDTTNTHGTGCSLSSSLATTLAQTGDFARALNKTKLWLSRAIRQADVLEVGKGNGPIHHFHAQAPQEHLYPVAESGQEAEFLEKLRTNFSATVYELSRDIRQQVNTCDFVLSLGAGTLPQDAFIYYLDQDAQYLTEYSRALARLSTLSPQRDARLFFGHSAVEAIEVEAAMHDSWTSRFADSPMVTGQPGEVTKTYTDFLLAKSAENYPVAAAAILPCYWLYADIGVLLKEQLVTYEGEHPYSEWLGTYGDEGFQEAAQSAINYVDQAAEEATDAQLLAMKDAFIRACYLELAFFEAPLEAACHLLEQVQVK